MKAGAVMAECFISNDMLFTKYNPYYYASLIQEIEDEIEDMYTLSIPSVYIDESIGQISIGSYRIEPLVISIVERKERLDRLKEYATKHCSDLQQALSTVSPKYQYNLIQAQESGNRGALNTSQMNAITKALWNIVSSRDKVVRLSDVKLNKNISEGMIIQDEILS
ncbi:hypothetical protein NGC67_01860 [Mammaliicoccus fleurettii]|uniref:hypothetical protein n=1 Tax=Mammaliicoccus fleurettii TaxID=150056 RepID=UPI002DBBFD43|nr:hypothetical protein [Mammaliicoccus fleurettii]MEB7805415.1 hypothetical protein [Mammaliicoccus fleurettii]